MTVMEAYDSFILSRRLSGLSDKTISDYEQFVYPFVSSVLDSEFDNLSQTDINNYISSVLKKPLSRSSRSTYIRHLKIFLLWCQNQYGSSYNAALIRVPKASKRNVHIYEPEEIKYIFSEAKAQVPWLTYRNRCIIALMYDSGLRQSEVCTLLRKDISFTADRLMVTGKGDKQRTVPLGHLAKQYMLAYLESCPYECDRVFVGRRGDPLTCNAVKLFVTKLADSLPFELSSHKLRHNFATNYCMDQYEKYGHVDIYRLMYLMGHEEIKTTQRYLHMANEIIAAKNHISHLDNIVTGEI